MKIGFVGLGKMGLNMVRRLRGGGHEVVAFDLSPAQRQEAEAVGAVAAASLEELAEKLPAPRVVWLMLPAGKITEGTLDALVPLLQKGDIVVDGGNADFHDSRHRAARLAAGGLHFVDCGTSGGVWGLTQGYCLMVGGDREAFAVIEPALRTLAPTDGYRHVGPSGAGHFAKMVHNAIEYGMMQAYGEGFALLHAARQQYGYDYDLPEVGQLWGEGAVIRSWLLTLLTRALHEDPELSRVSGYVEDSGMGRTFAKEAVDAGVAAPALTLALQMRFASRQPDAFALRCAAALRNQFGGHAVILKERK
jgi:6-phosphogluconate dehydrogenase